MKNLNFKIEALGAELYYYSSIEKNRHIAFIRIFTENGSATFSYTTSHRLGVMAYENVIAYEVKFNDSIENLIETKGFLNVKKSYIGEVLIESGSPRDVFAKYVGRKNDMHEDIKHLVKYFDKYY